MPRIRHAQHRVMISERSNAGKLLRLLTIPRQSKGSLVVVSVASSKNFHVLKNIEKVPVYDCSNQLRRH